MPTYQYACTACGHQLEAVQSFTDEPLTECPTCAGRLRKLFNSVGIVFKGSGFYRTDSRTDSGSGSGSTAGKPAAASNDSGSSSDSTSKDSTSSGSTSNGSASNGSAAGGATSSKSTGASANSGGKKTPAGSGTS